MNEDTVPSQDLFYDSLIASYVDSPRFAARDWLWQHVRAALEQPSCRFVLLTADPGAGKSGFMAWTARSHPNWPRYFIRQNQRKPLEDGGARGFLEKIGFQLAARYPAAFQTDAIRLSVSQAVGTSAGQVTGAEVDRLIASPFYNKAFDILQEVKDNQGSVTGIRFRELVTDPSRISISDLQRMALLAPALALLGQDRNEPIVILIDALDELRYRALGDTVVDWLIQCPELPANVRILITSRPDPEWLAAFRSAQQARLLEETIPHIGDDIRNDLAAYAGKLAAIPKVASYLVAHKPPDQSPQEAQGQFVANAVKKSGGNLGYLDAVGRAIDQTIANNDQALLEGLLTLRQLPDTLQDLYGHFLKLLRSSVGDTNVVVEDPVSHVQGLVGAWTNLYRPVLGVLAVAMEPLMPSQIRRLGRILAGDDDASAAIGRLRQFLDVQGAHFTFYHSTVSEFLVSQATRENPEYRELAVDPVIQHQGIVAYYRNNAPTWNDVDWTKVDDYGFRHLAAHLAELDRFATEGHHLTACDRSVCELICKPLMNAKLTRPALRASFTNDLELAAQAAAAVPVSWKHLSRICLVDATLRSWATNLPPELLGVLAELGQESQALSYASLMQSSAARSEALRTIGLSLFDSGQVESGQTVIKEALAVSENAFNPSVRARCLSVAALALTTAELPTREDWAKQAIQAGQTAVDATERRAALSRVANDLARAGFSDLAHAAVRYAIRDVIEKKPFGGWVSGLEVIAEARAEEAKESQKAKDWVEWNTPSQTDPAANEWGWIALYPSAQRTAQHNGQIDAVIELLAEGEATDVALAAASEIEEPVLRAEYLISLAMGLLNANRLGLANQSARQALEISQGLEDAHIRANVVRAAVAILAEAQDTNGLHRAVEASATIGEERWKTEAICTTVSALGCLGDLSGIRNVRRVAEAIGGDYDRVHILSATGRALAKCGAFAEALDACEDALQGFSRVSNQYDRMEVSPVVEGACVACVRALFGNLAMAHEFAQMESYLDHFVSALDNAELRITSLRVYGAAVEALIQIGAEDEATSLTNWLAQTAQKADEPRVTALVHAAISHAYREIDPERSRREATRALNIVHEVHHKDQRALILSLIIVPLAQAGLGTLALDITMKIQSKWRPVILSALAVASGEQRDSDLALKAASVIADKKRRSSAVAAVAHALARAGVAEQAIGAARTIEDSQTRDQTLETVAVRLAQAGAAREALEAALTISEKRDREQTIAAIVQTLAQFDASTSSWNALQALAEGLGAEEKLMFRSLLDKSLTGVIHGLIGRYELEKATATCVGLSDKRAQALALCDVFRGYVSARAATDSIRQQALETTNREIESYLPSATQDAHSDALKAIAQLLADTQWRDEATSLCTGTSDIATATELQKILSRGTSRTAEQSQPKHGTLAGGIRSRDDRRNSGYPWRRRAAREIRCRALTVRAMLQALPLMDDLSVCRQARLMAHAIGNSKNRVSALDRTERRLSEITRDPGEPGIRNGETSRDVAQERKATQDTVWLSRVLSDSDDAYQRLSVMVQPERIKRQVRAIVALIEIQKARRQESAWQDALQNRNPLEEVHDRAQIMTHIQDGMYEGALRAALGMEPGTLQGFVLSETLRNIANKADPNTLDKCMHMAQVSRSQVMCRSEVICHLSVVLANAGRLEEARQGFARALLAAREDGPVWTFRVLEGAASSLATLDDGQTLLQVFQFMLTVETWWPWRSRTQ